MTLNDKSATSSTVRKAGRPKTKHPYLDKVVYSPSGLKGRIINFDPDDNSVGLRFINGTQTRLKVSRPSQ